MSYERSERRTYRRSPGRQYGDEFDPLRSQPLSGSRQSGRLGAPAQSGSLTASLRDAETLDERRTSGVLAPRPDARRTRQLLRQQILATKARGGEDTGQIDPDIDVDHVPFDEEHPAYEDYYVAHPVQRRSGSVRFPSAPLRARRTTREYADPTGAVEPPPVPYADELEYLDPDVGYDDEFVPPAQPGIEGEEDRGSRKKKGKKGLLSRRKLIAGAILVGGGAVAAYELGPKIPQALETAGANIEHQIQNAFNQGFAAGGEAVRKEFINALDTLEGVSLEGAIGAAKLTRVAYDVFVSPIITLASTIASDFLSALLNALVTARGWLQQINADNATLVALTGILQNWVKQAHIMPKELQTITDTDLDGAQAYLNALQRKIQEEQAKLNGQVTPTPSSASPTPRPGASVTPGPTITATPGQ
jgi:hypothetical protein